MNRAQKEAFVVDLSKGIEKAQAIALLSFTSITVEQMTSFRLSLSKEKVNVRVVKNTLAKRVFGATAFKDVVGQFVGPTLIAYSDGDPIVTAKAIQQWADKENFNVKIKGGVALGQVMSTAQLKSLAMLPGRNELLVSFLWALKSHPTRLLYALQDAPKRLGYALNALKESREKQSAN